MGKYIYRLEFIVDPGSRIRRRRKAELHQEFVKAIEIESPVCQVERLVVIDCSSGSELIPSEPFVGTIECSILLSSKRRIDPSNGLLDVILNDLSLLLIEVIQGDSVWPVSVAISLSTGSTFPMGVVVLVPKLALLKMVW